jgi:hypothetical protein
MASRTAQPEPAGDPQSHHTDGGSALTDPAVTGKLPALVGVDTVFADDAAQSASEWGPARGQPQRALPPDRLAAARDQRTVVLVADYFLPPRRVRTTPRSPRRWPPKPPPDGCSPAWPNSTRPSDAHDRQADSR